MTPLQHLVESEQLRKMKLKDMRYHIKGIDSERPVNECIQAIAAGYYIAIALLLTIRLIDYIITGS